MQSRRALLTALGLAIPGLALAGASSRPAALGNMRKPGTIGALSRIPNVKVKDHAGREFKFYDDLVKNRLVLISFASLAGEQRYSIVNNLLKLQQMEANRLGKDLFIYTITTQPERDSSDQLAAYAKSRGARWQFLTGDAASVKQLKDAFGVMNSIHGLVWIGNDSTGRWLSKPARLQPLFLAESLAFLSTGAQHRQFLRDMRSVRS